MDTTVSLAPLTVDETLLKTPPPMGNPISGATMVRSVTFSMARYASFTSRRPRRILVTRYHDRFQQRRDARR